MVSIALNFFGILLFCVISFDLETPVHKENENSDGKDETKLDQIDGDFSSTDFEMKRKSESIIDADDEMTKRFRFDDSELQQTSHNKPSSGSEPFIHIEALLPIHSPFEKLAFRRTSDRIFLSVNGRPIKSRKINKLLTKRIRKVFMIEGKQFPTAIVKVKTTLR